MVARICVSCGALLGTVDAYFDPSYDTCPRTPTAPTITTRNTMKRFYYSALIIPLLASPLACEEKDDDTGPGDAGD